HSHHAPSGSWAVPRQADGKPRPVGVTPNEREVAHPEARQGGFSTSGTIVCSLNARGTRGVLAFGAVLGRRLLKHWLSSQAWRRRAATVWPFDAGAARRFWMASQIRVVAALRSVNFLIGFTVSKPEVPAKEPLGDGRR